MLLKNEHHTVLVSLGGAQISGWWHDGKEIFYSQRPIVCETGAAHIRGGLYPCFPLFGRPPKEGIGSTLPKHGVLRDLCPTAILDASPKRSVVHFGASAFDLPFSGNPAVRVTAALVPSGFVYEVNVTQEGAFSSRMPFMLGLHPYFHVPSSAFVSGFGFEEHYIGGVTGPRLMKLESREILLKIFSVGWVKMTLDSHFTHAVIWTDREGMYLCIEPITGDPAFFGTPDGLWLQPDESFTARCLFELMPPA